MEWRQMYLRDDLPCHASACDACATLPEYGAALGRISASVAVCFVPDALVLLYQMDLLESDVSPLMDELLLLQSVLSAHGPVGRADGLVWFRRSKTKAQAVERKRKQFALFSNEHHVHTYLDRLPHESDIEYDRRRLTETVKFLRTHWQPFGLIPIILTNSVAFEREAPVKYGGDVTVMSIRTLVDKYSKRYSRLVELCALGNAEDDEALEEEGGELDDEELLSKKRRTLFAEHISELAALEGLQSGRYVEGTFRSSPYNLLEASVSVALHKKSNPDDRTTIMLIGKSSHNRAFDGDRVVIELLDRSEWKTVSDRIVEQEAAQDKESDDGDTNGISHDQVRKDATPSGRVVRVSQRKWQSCSGSLQQSSHSGGGNALFVPADRKIPLVRVLSARIRNLFEKRLIVAVDSWSRFSANPSGHVVQEIGSSGDKNAETEVILIESSVPHRKFSKAALDCLPDGEKWAVSEEHIHKRWDLKSKPIASVDPPECTDIDDALHCVSLPDGEGYEVGIHIADVTAFVQHGSALDMEAAERGTTVYLVDRRFEMLPAMLTSNFCSLVGGVERLAFSVILVMDKDANVLSAEFGRSVIKSRRAMTYEQAQNMLDGIRSKRDHADELGNSLLGLASLAEKLRQRRTDAGALSLASPEVSFELEAETNDVTDVKFYQIRETNKMVEEFMLLSNIQVAEKILKHFPKCSLLRHHPKPTDEMFEPLLKTAAAYGIELDVSSNKTLNESLNRVELAFGKKDPYLSTLLRMLTTWRMSQAVYFSSGELGYSDYLHYGLAAPVCTHFTSPIRRYADVIVHRQLQACIGYSALPEVLYDSKHIKGFSNVMNELNRSAQYAPRKSVHLHTLMFFRHKAMRQQARTARMQRIAW
ncbi:Exosome complex exonuclease RRP44-like A [Porphyridium purpureum]|uniref:Exosome complex exonuclease RRP44-like A n=1 Tax=Porphyridium purpureum TaxID=35688 RepID=A0A5J4YMC6_PORPP|nr:Exosome complex exonuclease RRP44-like A [Porphyridium purpureum]KAA8491547.1 Exosome complex exonuclease RRP44-like A [Porphyridium purpureum]|eukprot:POR3712..scf228_30